MFWKVMSSTLVTPWLMRIGNHSPQASNSASSTDLERIQFPHCHCFFSDFRGDETFTTSGSGCRVPSSSPSLSCCQSSGNLSWRLFQKIVKGLNANQWHSFWGTASAHEQVAQVCVFKKGTQNTGCWQQQVHLRKKCYHSCNIDLVWESTGFNGLQILGSD